MHKERARECRTWEKWEEGFYRSATGHRTPF
jgi:hypothetical protein